MGIYQNITVLHDKTLLHRFFFILLVDETELFCDKYLPLNIKTKNEKLVNIPVK